MRGLITGVGATVVMSLVMLASQRAGLMDKQPPERIVERGAGAIGIVPDRDAVQVAASVAHLGFGAAGGAGFGWLASVVRPGIPELLGVPWAMTIWLVSYAGWIPALRILPKPTDDRPGRAWTMLAAHIVYGITLGTCWRFVAPR